MNTTPQRTKYSLLLTSLSIWLCCAWISHRSPLLLRATPNSLTVKAVSVYDTSITASKSGELRHDPESGLAIDETMPIVKGQCTACHSSKLILQSHFDRDKWIERIRWMQRTQKLWDLGETEKPILDYLVKYYGPLATPFDGRRLPLPAPVWHKL